MPHAGCSEPVNVFRWWDNSQQCNHAAELKTCLKAALVLADVESIYGNTIATYSKCSEIKTQAVQFIHNIICSFIVISS